jgi:hypothetical protein
LGDKLGDSTKTPNLTMCDIVDISDVVTRKYCNIPLYFFSNLVAFDIDCLDFTCSGTRHNIDALFSEITARLKQPCIVRYYQHGIHIYLNEDEYEVIEYLQGNIHTYHYWIEPMYQLSLCGGPDKKIKMLAGDPDANFFQNKLKDPQQLVRLYNKTLFLKQLLQMGLGASMESLLVAYDKANTPSNNY